MNQLKNLFGIFYKPAATFDRISNLPKRNSDWIVPMAVLIILFVTSRIIIENHPVIRRSFSESSLKAVENQFDDLVKKGVITKSQAEQQFAAIQNKVEQRMSTAKIISLALFIFAIKLTGFFLIAGIYFGFVKILFQGKGTYKDAIIACGLPGYILALQVVIAFIISLVEKKAFMNTSIGAIWGLDINSFSSYLLSKADLFSVWFYSVTSIGLSKMFKSSKAWKYFLLIFCLWFFSILIIYFGQKAVPQIRWFN